MVTISSELNMYKVNIPMCKLIKASIVNIQILITTFYILMYHFPLNKYPFPSNYAKYPEPCTLSD